MTLLQELSQSPTFDDALTRIIDYFNADSGTIHMRGRGADDADLLHLKAASAGIPDAVIEIVRVVPVGKGMAGLAVERNAPVDSCNIQTDESGDVRPGAKATGLEGSIVVPIRGGDDDDAAIGALGIANRTERTFTDDEQAALLEAGRAIARLA